MLIIESKLLRFRGVCFETWDDSFRMDVGRSGEDGQSGCQWDREETTTWTWKLIIVLNDAWFEIMVLIRNVLRKSSWRRCEYGREQLSDNHGRTGITCPEGSYRYAHRYEASNMNQTGRTPTRFPFSRISIVWLTSANQVRPFDRVLFPGR